MKTALTIAGSDSCGGAGIQADLKTFAAHGVYGTCAITAVTAQNTLGVEASENLSVDLIVAQVAALLPSLPTPYVVVDPVMVAKSGSRLLAKEAVDTVRRTLLPRATVVTPNAMEAEVLAKVSIDSLDAAREAARRIHDLGPGTVVIKGGHLPTADAVDLVYDGDNYVELRGPRLPSRQTHGTGCTFAAAVAANLARGHPTPDAIAAAKHYVAEAIRHGLPLGRGHGPLDHFWQQ